MKVRALPLFMVKSEQIIKNINLPTCINCIHYKLNTFDNDFASTLNKCKKFGEKDIVTNKITYDYATSCRSDKSKCGNEGKYFEEEKNINMKILKHTIIQNFPYSFLFLCSLLLNYYLIKF
jgi:hypothetical protein